MNDKREKAITATSIIGIVVNIFLVSFKALVGVITGSIAVVLDAINNITDALGSVITIVGIKLAKRKPNAKHPYGYGRIEYFSALIISIIVLGAGVSSLVESVKAIIKPEVADYNTVSIIIIAVSMVVKFVLGRFVQARGKKFNSDALVASGADSTFDSFITASTLVAAIVTLIFHISIDGFVGAFIAIFIIKAGIEMMLEAISHVMGKRPDSAITKEIKEIVKNIPGVIGAYDLVLHDYGPEFAIGSVHVEIPSDMTAGEIHRMIMSIQYAVYEKCHIMLTVGIYAVEQNDSEIINMRENIYGMCNELDGVINSHGFFVEPEYKMISFDITTDFTIVDKKAFIGKVSDMIGSQYPEYKVEINLDTNYSN